MSNGAPCLPTPPGSEGDSAPETVKSTASYPDQTAAMTAAIAAHSQVGPAADQLGPASSFAGRRPQADSLPAVQMPHSRDVSAGAVTYSSPYGVPANRGTINNILTPSGESAPLSAGVNSVQQNASPYGYWPQSAPLQGSYPYSNMPSQYSSQHTPNMPSRPSYSPPSSLPSRSNLTSPTNADMPVPPTYDMNAAARYQTTMAMSAPAATASSSLPPMMANSRAQNPYSQSQMGSTAALASPTYAPYGVQSNTGYFGSVQTTQPPQYGSYSPYTTQHQSLPAQGQRLSPTMPNASQASLQRIYPAPTAYTPYNYSSRQSLPSLDNPVMTNAHVPGGNLSMFGGPHAHSGVLTTSLLPPQGGPAGPSYSAYGQAPPQNDKPFKCNECPQAFNRNHDLKRHQKIHLAIKPFPCTNCDKSFSRKDALKRHILVKGCGNKKRSSDSDPAVDFNSTGSNERDADGETSA